MNNRLERIESDLGVVGDEDQAFKGRIDTLLDFLCDGEALKRKGFTITCDVEDLYNELLELKVDRQKTKSVSTLRDIIADIFEDALYAWGILKY